MSARRDREYMDAMIGDGGDLRYAPSESKRIGEIMNDVRAGRNKVALMKLAILQRQAVGGYHANPPGGEQFGKQVIAVEYIHAVDGKPYRHEFGRGVALFANPDGTLAIAHPTRRAWAEFR